MEQLQVGKKYPGNFRQEGVKLDYNKGFTLYVFLPQITYNEALGFKKGKYKFAITELESVSFFLYEFKGATDLSDAPFHFGLYNDDRIKDLPKELGENQGIGLNIIVVDSKTGIVKALRLIGLSHEFSKQLIDICIKQSKEKIDPKNYSMKLLEIQQRFSSKGLYNMAKIECF